MQPLTQTETQKGKKQVHRPHQGRLHRNPKLRKRPLRPLELIPQGEAILAALDTYRMMTNEQVAELLFRRMAVPGGAARSDLQYHKTANRSLGDLLDLGLSELMPAYLRHRHTKNVFLTAVHILTPAGRDALQRVYDRAGDGAVCRLPDGIKQYAYQTISHDSEITDLAIALERGVPLLGCTLYDWHADHHFRRMAKNATSLGNLRPDGFCVVESPDGRLCPLFVEVDRGTEHVRSQWKEKYERYCAYLTGRYASDPFYTGLDPDYDPAAMANPIVLTMTTGAERRDNMRAVTERLRGRFWYTTQNELFQFDPPTQRMRHRFGAVTGSIWHLAGIDEPRSLADHLLGLREPS